MHVNLAAAGSGSAAAVCSFHTAAHIIFYFFHFSSPSIFDSLLYTQTRAHINTPSTDAHNHCTQRAQHREENPFAYTKKTTTTTTMRSTRKFSQQTRKMLPTIVSRRAPGSRNNRTQYFAHTMVSPTASKMGGEQWFSNAYCSFRQPTRDDSFFSAFRFLLQAHSARFFD